MIGNQLEVAGWRQGSVVRADDAKQIADIANIVYSKGMQFIVASHSCDIANNNLEFEPNIELMEAKCIEKGDVDGNFTDSKKLIFICAGNSTDNHVLTDRSICV